MSDHIVMSHDNFMTMSACHVTMIIWQKSSWHCDKKETSDHQKLILAKWFQSLMNLSWQDRWHCYMNSIEYHKTIFWHCHVTRQCQVTWQLYDNVISHDKKKSSWHNIVTKKKNILPSTMISQSWSSNNTIKICTHTGCPIWMWDKFWLLICAKFTVRH